MALRVCVNSSAAPRSPVPIVALGVRLPCTIRSRSTVSAIRITNESWQAARHRSADAHDGPSCDDAVGADVVDGAAQLRGIDVEDLRPEHVHLEGVDHESVPQRRRHELEHDDRPDDDADPGDDVEQPNDLLVAQPQVPRSDEQQHGQHHGAPGDEPDVEAERRAEGPDHQLRHDEVQRSEAHVAQRPGVHRIDALCEAPGGDPPRHHDADRRQLLPEPGHPHDRPAEPDGVEQRGEDELERKDDHQQPQRQRGTEDEQHQQVGGQRRADELLDRDEPEARDAQERPRQHRDPPDARLRPRRARRREVATMAG